MDKSKTETPTYAIIDTMIANVLALSGIATLLLYWWGLQEIFPTSGPVDLDVHVVLFSVLGGVLPALLWLWFWLKEDKEHPEPRGLILLSFLAGMAAVPFTIPFEQAVYAMFSSQAMIIVLWAFIEEVIKFIAIYLVAFKSKFFDEPIDALIYLITGALGFSALENSMYLLNSLVDGGIFVGAINTHLRFLGATLLHVVASSAIGVAIAFSFYRRKRRAPLLVIGIIASTLLHALFNLFIIESQGVLETLIVFSYYWLIVIVLIFVFERIKIIKRPFQQVKPKPMYVRER